LERASKAFLKLATNIETLLFGLPLKEEVSSHLQQEEILASMMGNMNLTS